MRYHPPAGQWQARAPEELGMDGEALRVAIAHHRAHETTWSRDFLTPSGRDIGVADEPDDADAVAGPIAPRGGPNGLVVRHGVIAAEWGETERVDMSFSIAKSYLAVIAGLALARGVIRDLDEPVHRTVDDGGFESPQNRAITWRQLLQQTSEWQGTLWGKPDSIDHNRDVGKSELGQADKGQPRPLGRPGTVWEYNDVRVNRLSLALLRVLRQPLADVLAEGVMRPIGASETWAWHPYRSAWVDVAGVRMPSVPGGSHWGGGLFMSSRDHARFGLLILRRGRWQDAELVPGSVIDEVRRPCALNPEYGLRLGSRRPRKRAAASRGAPPAS
jgi:CubicO group peptidase (beta-lactamase class C family)